MSELVLGIDTSHRVAVGLARDERVLASRIVGDTRSHVEMAATTVRDVLASGGVRMRDVTRIGVGVGPGPFTGLRVGIATAQILGQALGVPVIGVCSLDIIALRHAAGLPYDDGEFVTVLDARRHEVYWARYDASGLRVAGPFVGAPDTLPMLPAVGPDMPAACPLDAGYLASNLDELPSVGLEPLYLRQPDADLPSTRKSTIVGGHLRVPVSVTS